MTRSMMFRSAVVGLLGLAMMAAVSAQVDVASQDDCDHLPAE